LHFFYDFLIPSRYDEIVPNIYETIANEKL
jgi:hypothetical protein